MSKDFTLHGIESIKPVGKKVLVELNPIGEKKTAGGVYLPDLHHEEFRIGFILAVGDEVKGFDAGDKVLVGWVFGESIHIPDRGILNDTLRIGTQAEIWAKLTEKRESEE